MFTNHSSSEFINLFYESVEEITVVAHYDSSSIEIFYSLLQHVLRLHIQVVGGFVKNQQVYWFEK